MGRSQERKQAEQFFAAEREGRRCKEEDEVLLVFIAGQDDCGKELLFESWPREPCGAQNPTPNATA